jgi:hypothetical protein
MLLKSKGAQVICSPFEYLHKFYILDLTGGKRLSAKSKMALMKKKCPAHHLRMNIYLR